MNYTRIGISLLCVVCLALPPAWAEPPTRRGILDDIGNAVGGIGQDLSNWWNGFDPLNSASWPADLGSIDSSLFSHFDAASVATFFHSAGTRVKELSSNLFAQMDWQAFSALGQEALSQLSASQFFALPDAVFSQLQESQVAALAKEVWQQVEVASFKRLPQRLYSAIDADSLGQLPATLFAQLNAEEFAAFTAESLQGLNSAQFALVRDEALAQLNTEQLAQLPLAVLNRVGLPELQSFDRAAWWGLAQQAPGRFSDWLTQLDNARITPEQLQAYLPQGLKIDPQTGEFVLLPEDFLLSYPRLQFAAGLLPDNLRYAPPYDLRKGFGLGGSGADALGQIQNIINGQVAGFSLQQSAEGVLELAGPDGISLPFWVLDAQVRKVSDSVPPGIGVDLASGAFTLTSENAIQFKVVYAPPGILRLAKAFGIGANANDPGSMSINAQGVICTVPPRSRQADTEAWFPPYRVHAYTPAQAQETAPSVERLPADAGGFNQRLRIQYADGSTQIAYPTVPNPEEFSQTLQQLGIPASHIQPLADGGFSVLIPQADDSLKALKVWFSTHPEMSDLAPGEKLQAAFDFGDLGNMAFVTQLDCATHKRLRLPFVIQWLE